MHHNRKNKYVEVINPETSTRHKSDEERSPIREAVVLHLKQWFAKTTAQPQEEQLNNKKRAWNLLNDKPDIRTELKYTQQEAEDSLKGALLKMRDYDFMVSTYKIPRNTRAKTCLRVVYLSFSCSSYKCDRWFTSGLGTFQISFTIKKMNEQRETRKYPYLITLNARIFRMQCQQCLQYCNGKIYDSHLQALEIQFSYIITQILNGVKPKKNKNIPHTPDLRDHMIELCEACQEGLCMRQNVYKPLDQINGIKQTRGSRTARGMTRKTNDARQSSVEED